MNRADVFPLSARLHPGERLGAEAIFDRFLDYVADLGLDLYPAQEEAILELLSDKNVILNTPTGSGKSLVAAALHFKALAEGRRSLYTSPIKALANEKFFDLCRQFGPAEVGLLTGDASVNRDAPIVCCTAEILANIALREGAGAEVDYAVLDEFHYYADRERGVAWQVPLLTLPQTTFLLMSATLGDMTFFCEELTRLNGRPTVVVRSTERPVPLEFHYSELPIHTTVARLVEGDRAPVYLVNFTQRACHEQAQNLMSVDICSKEDKRAIATELAGFRFDTPYGKEVARFVRHGIGIHHGGLLPKYRRLVERVAQRGLLKVISGTDTLGVGVNIPIRTVLFTRLYKFDGSGSKILAVRDFQQIAGRAGRKGFDDRGTVVALAPEHVAENLLLEEKAKADPSKKKKLVKRKPPTHGYVHWDRGTFDKLVHGTPEPLVSRFEVSHAMLVNVLSRREGGCAAMKTLIRRSHDRPAQQRIHGRRAIQLMRGLLRSGVVELVDRDEGRAPAVRINADLQQGFSLNHALSLYLVDTIALLDREREAYPLDVLSLVEAILENPDFLLDRQLDRIKRERLAELKAEGVEYEERMEELAKLEHPKPNREFVYATFDEFAVRHPWVGPESIRPKGVARELYEQYLGFGEAVREYAIERSEGLLLRYMAEVYRTLVQNVPESAWNDGVDDLIAYVHGFVRGIDSSLLDEWEALRDPDYLPKRLAEPETAEPPPPRVTSDLRAFTVLLRNQVFMLVRALARRQYEAAAELVVAPPDGPSWSAAALERALAPFYDDHSAIRFDAGARGTEYTLVDRRDERLWRVTQKLADPEGYDDWSLGIVVDLDRCDDAGAVVVELERIG